MENSWDSVTWNPRMKLNISRQILKFVELLKILRYAPATFNEAEYFYYDMPCHGDMHEVVRGKFFAFKGPTQVSNRGVYIRVYTYVYICVHKNVFLVTMCRATGWRRLIGSPKLQITFHKRATKYRSLLPKMIYKDKGSYESSPPCMETCRKL